MRKVMGSANPAQAKGKNGVLTPSQIDEKKELLRLKREIREKKALERRLAELEDEA